MANDYYNASGIPTTSAAGSSSVMRSEFASLAGAFAKLPALTGFANKAVVVNSLGTALVTTVGSLALAGNLTLTGAFNLNLIAGASVNMTLPLVDGTYATLAGTETFTNKTLTTPTITGPVFSGVATGSLTSLQLTTPTLTTPTISNPVFSGTSTGSLTIASATLPSPTLSGTVAGTYTLGGTPTGSAILNLSTGSTTPRTIGVRASEQVNPKDFAAVGDGVTTDQVAVAAAVAAAFAAGSAMYWPKGTYLTTATIPNFHSVKHRGPGIVKRGANLFYVDPSSQPGNTNNLFIETTGVDTNDGFSTSEPLLSGQTAGNLIYLYPYADVTWKLNFGAGTHSVTTYSFSRSFPTPRQVQFNGVAVARGVQPTTIFQNPTPNSGTEIDGIYFQNKIEAFVSNINFKSYRAGAAVTALGTNSAIVIDGRCNVYTDNVWTDDCDNGIYVTNASQIRCQAGRHGFNLVNGTNIVAIRHAHGTIGYGGSAADITGATGTAFIGGAYGVALYEFSMLHTDNCYYSNQTLAGIILNVSRVHCVTSTFDTIPVAMDARMNSNLGNTSNTFIACPIETILRSGSTNAGVPFSDSLDFGAPTKQIVATNSDTQSATPVTFFTKAFEAKELQNRGQGWKLRLYCEVVGVANTKTVVITFGATTMLTATIAASTTDYYIEVEMMNVTGASAQKYITKIFENGVLPKIIVTTNMAEDLTAAKTLTCTHQVTNVADLNRIGFSSLEITH